MAEYQPMQNPVANWGFVADIISRARQSAKEQDARRAELLLRQQSAERENARLDEQMRHTSELEQRQRRSEVADLLPKIKAGLTPGDPSYDPETWLSVARAHDVNLNALAPTMPTAPEMPQSKPIPQLNGDLDAVSGGAAQPEAAQNTALDATRASMQDDYQKQLAAAQRRAPTYSGTSPVGPISIDPNAAVAAREERLRQQQEQMHPLAGAVDEEFRPVVLGMIQAGMPASEIAKAVGERRKQMAEDAIKKKYNADIDLQDKWHRWSLQGALANAGAKRAQAGDDNPQVGADVTQHLIENPGDIPGAYRVAGRAGSVSPTKTVGAAVTQTKPSESQERSAEQAAQGLAALDAIEKNGYRPNDADLQQWINNQRSVQRAEDLAKGGILGTAAAGIGQGVGVLRRSEFDNMSPEAASFFANYRRVMEPIARKQSGAAISESEWRNFFNQWGPQSPGGLAAARRDLSRMARGGGVATRQIEPQRQPSQNEKRADTLKNAGKSGPTMDDLMKFEKEHGL